MVEGVEGSGSDVVVFRPHRLKIVGIAFAVAMCALSAYGWLALPADQRALFSWSQRLTLLGFLGVIVFVLLAMASSYVQADSDGIRLRNGLRRHQVDWDRVHKIVLRPGDPWAFMLLKPVDGTPFEVDIDAEKRQLFGIQSNDGERARQAIQELQRRHRLARVT